MAASKAKPEKRSLGFWELHRVRFWPLPLKATWGLFGEELFVWKDFFYQFVWKLSVYHLGFFVVLLS